MKLLIVALFLSMLPFGAAFGAGEAPDPLREQAQGGNAAAQLKLADEYFFGRGRVRNQTLAVYWFRQAARQGNSQAAYNLAVCLEKGWGVPPSLNQAFGFYRQAAEGGEGEALCRYALLLYDGVPEEKHGAGLLAKVPADPPTALEVLRSLSGRGYAKAKLELAKLLYRDLKKRAESGPEIRQLLEECYLEAQPIPEALLLLAECRRTGLGGAGSMTGAADAMERAAALGNAEGKARYARILEYGQGRKPDPKRAFELVREAATAADPSPLALVRLGDYYLTGDFMPHDPVRAAECFAKAVDLRYPPAFLRLGNAYAEGVGVERDPERAFEEFSKGARMGDTAAQYRLGLCFQDGFGIAADPAGAVFWFRNGTAGGNLDAMRALGVCLVEGRGVEKNEAEGAKLIRAAADAGDAEARLILTN